MSIQAIRSVNVKAIPFSASENAIQQEKTCYENPINRKTERNLAIISSAGVSVLLGVIAGGATAAFKKGWKIPTYVGIASALASMAISLPSKLYKTKVMAFTREKEMDVFSRKKEAQATIYEDINNEVKNDEVSLAEKIKNYSTVAIADNGKGMIIKGDA